MQGVQVQLVLFTFAFQTALDLNKPCSGRRQSCTGIMRAQGEQETHFGTIIFMGGACSLAVWASAAWSPNEGLLGDKKKILMCPPGSGSPYPDHRLQGRRSITVVPLKGSRTSALHEPLAAGQTRQKRPQPLCLSAPPARAQQRKP